MHFLSSQCNFPFDFSINMKTTPSLVILAAGLGSRYGSLKQLDPLGPSGETILDYTIYDAIEAGFKKIVFIIKEELAAEFKEIFFDKLSGKVKVEVVFQSVDKLPVGYSVPTGRIRPWGTAHALLMTESKINEPFAIVNADDFYGKSSLKLAFNQLSLIDESQISACLIGFVLKNTLSENGTVSRGICQVNNERNLIEIVERTKISKGIKHPYYEEDGKTIPLTGNEIVSMNLMGFSPAVFTLIEQKFKEFLDHNIISNDLNAEYYTPFILDEVRRSGLNVPVLESQDHWFGVTYKNDKEIVMKKLRVLVDAKAYPSPLWQ